MWTEGARVGSERELSHALAHVRRGAEVLHGLWKATLESGESPGSWIPLTEARQALHRALIVLQDMSSDSPERDPEQPTWIASGEGTDRSCPYVPDLAPELAPAITDLIAEPNPNPTIA
jgi:hypothetical protein